MDAAAPVIAAFSPSLSSRDPIEFAIAASEVTGAPLVVVHVRVGGPMVTHLAGRVDDSAGDDERGLEHLRIELARRKIPVSIEAVDSRTVAGGLKRAIEKHAPVLVVLGSSTRSAVGSVVMGGTAEHLVHEAVCPIAVVPSGYKRPEQGVQLVGAAYDGGPDSRAVLEDAATIARRGGVKLRVISVQEGGEEQSPGLMAEQHRDTDPRERSDARRRFTAESELRATVAEVAAGVDAEIDLLAGDPGDALIGASRHVDLLVMGARGRGARRAAVLGSVSRKVAGGASCPLLVLPRGAGEASRHLAGSVQAREPR